MKVSLNWAQHYSQTDLKSLPTDELVKLATERLGGVEGVTDLSRHYEGIVVAKVMSCVKHPNADKLSLCKIDDGGMVQEFVRDENGYIQVVCGAPNVREGLLVAWIPPSSVVPASYGEKELFVLEARDLRGELSNGMLASPAELGMSDDHSGILEIEKEVSPGTDFKSIYGLDDLVIEIENKMFTHRPDCFGQLGVGRELAGIQHRQFRSPEWYLSPAKLQGHASDEVKGLGVTIEAGDLCPRYMAVCIEGVKIGPSPQWLQSYLTRVGVRPINNAVDITNYMMLLTAQPLHAFDFDKVSQDGRVDIAVRRPLEGEKMTLLDGKEIEPHKDALLICNSRGPIALGGVMGGGNSEVDESTTRIVLECATFDMYNIRKTSMIHGIFTDAVTRFNKGQPAAQLPPVLYKAIDMFEELTDAHMVGEVVDNYHEPVHNKGVEVSVEFINQRLGSSLSEEEITTLLTNVEIDVAANSGALVVTAPFWRTDIEIPEDVVEEVGRLYGFNRLPLELPTRSIKPVEPAEMARLKEQLTKSLTRAGANEVSTYSFVHGDLLKKAGQDSEQAFSIRNALSPDLQYYRLSLLPSLLDKVRPNIKAGYDQFTLFEIGKAHNKALMDDEPGLPDEVNYLEMVYASAKPKPGAAYYQMLRTVDYTLSHLGIPYKLVPVKDDTKLQSLRPFDPARSAYIYNASEVGGMIGFIGELKGSVQKAFKLPEHTAAALFALDGPSFETQNTQLVGRYKQLSKYEISKQDLTLQVAEDVQFAQVKDLLEDELAKSDYQSVLTTLGVYQKEGSPTKNITFRITLSHNDHTLTTNEVNKLVQSLSWQAHEQLGAQQA